MSVTFSRSAPLGMFELDAAGTVLYSRANADGPAGGPAPDLKGLNYFDDAGFGNASELRRRVNLFRAGGAPADNFDFTCECEDGPVPVRVLLARIREHGSGYDNASSVLIHLRHRN